MTEALWFGLAVMFFRALLDIAVTLSRIANALEPRKCPFCSASGSWITADGCDWCKAGRASGRSK